MTHLVIGTGEVGSSLQKVLDCDGVDRLEADDQVPQYDMIHICFGYSDEFESFVKDYQKRFGVKYTVVHSTVPIGTCKKLGVTNSPIRGKHPNLEQSIRTFTKHVGGVDAEAVAEELREKGINCITHASSNDTEAGKLLELMHYGAEVAQMKEVWQFCKDNKLDFDVAYTEFAKTYNQGYQELGLEQFTRPILKFIPGKIGGHCITQNMPKLNLPTARRILIENETYD